MAMVRSNGVSGMVIYKTVYVLLLPDICETSNMVLGYS